MARFEHIPIYDTPDVLIKSGQTALIILVFGTLLFWGWEWSRLEWLELDTAPMGPLDRFCHRLRGGNWFDQLDPFGSSCWQSLGPTQSTRNAANFWFIRRDAPPWRYLYFSVRDCVGLLHGQLAHPCCDGAVGHCGALSLPSP